MITTTLLALTMGMTLGGTTDINCEFPPLDGRGPHLSVVLSPAPSLRDLPGLYRARFSITNRDPIPARIQPIQTTASRDMAMTAHGPDDMIYALGFQDNGRAAINIRLGDREPAYSETRTGTCRGMDTHMKRWLPE